MIGIYKITNRITGDFYIGQSNNIQRRFAEHKKAGTCSELHKEIRRYGSDNFEFTILEECRKEDLFRKEAFYIKTLNPTYNCSIANVELFREKVSKGTREWWNNLDESVKQKIITQNLTGPAIGHQVSKETREKLRQANLGKKQSKETIELRKKSTKEYRKLHPQTNENHKKKVNVDGIEFESIKACAEYLGVSASHVSHAIKRSGKVKGCKVVKCRD